MCDRCTKICHSIQNYMDRGKYQLRQEFGDRYVCHNVKPLKTVCNYCAKICDLVKNYVQHAYFCTF